MTGEIEKLPTFLPGFDEISAGGLPKGRMSLVSGTAGSGKTIFATQFLAEGIRQANEPGVFVTFEETASDISRNVVGFGWNIEEWERNNQWAFLDGAFRPSDDDYVVAGAYDLGGLLVRIRNAVERIGARRVVLDSFAAILTRFPDTVTIRSELHRIAVALKELEVTAVITAERASDYGAISNSGMEEFVADSVVILRNVLDDERRRRTVEILKFRGAQHLKGEFPLTILPGQGMLVVPLTITKLAQGSSDARVTSGVPLLDQMCNGGYFRDSVILVSGATGTGKTLLVTEFLRGGHDRGERCLLLGFEESSAQLHRNARSWGADFEAMEESGRLRIETKYPEVAGPEDHLVAIKRLIEEFKPDRVAIDSLSALERITTKRSFREFLLGLTSYIKDQQIVALFTATTEQLLGGVSITDSNMSTVTDTIILLRYVERRGEVQRGLTVLKMRGSRHDKSIREFTIDESGMHIGEQLSELSGILAGAPIESTAGNVSRDSPA